MKEAKAEISLCQETAELSIVLQGQNNELVLKAKNLKANHIEDRKIIQGKDWKTKHKATEE